MTYHTALWMTIDYITNSKKISKYKLAQICSLDSTTFNPSKQYTSLGQPRWISTETLAKILINTNTSPIEFAEIFQSFLDMQEIIE